MNFYISNKILIGPYSSAAKIRYHRTIYFYDEGTGWVRPLGTTEDDLLGLKEFYVSKLKVKEVIPY